jgi:hypothetical protein
MAIIDRYRYIAFSCFVHDLEGVVAAVRQQVAEWDMAMVETRSAFDMGEIYSHEPRPGGAHLLKSAFFAPSIRPEVTVMFANYEDGWSSLATMVTRRIGGTAYQFGVGSERCEWPAYRFQATEGGRIKRHVSLIRDVSDWKFHQVGDTRTEEIADLYRKRTKRDRLSREYLIGLAERLGFPVGDDGFWRSRVSGVYMEERRG